MKTTHTHHFQKEEIKKMKKTENQTNEEILKKWVRYNYPIATTTYYRIGEVTKNTIEVIEL